MDERMVEMGRVECCWRLRGLSLAVVLLFVAGNATVADDRIRVACVGDSITYGAGVEDRGNNNYPKVLGRLLGESYDVRNFGVSGATLLKKGDLPWWNLDVFKKATEFNPSIVVIKLGTNDSKPQNWRHKEEFAGDLRALADHFRKLPAGPTVYLCRPVPVYRDRWGIREGIVWREVIPVIDEVAAVEALSVIDLHTALRGVPEYFPDGVHPNRLGADRLARAVYAELVAAAPSSTPRPNFVVMIADDMAREDCGAYGHPKIRTPTIDRLAAEGLRFDRAFLSCSSCSPSRASILTGRYPHATGAGELHLPLPAEQVTFVEKLKAAGYYTASAGKWHLGRDAERRFDRVYKGGGASGCEKWVGALRERPRDKPFFLWLAAVDPHRGYGKNAIPKPHSGADAVVPPYFPDVPETRDDLALYYDEISRMDSFMGEVLNELEEQKVERDTLVLFLSDNGRPFPRCKTTVYDSGIHTPFIVRWPSAVKANGVTQSLVSSVDIASTFLQLAGAVVPASFQGVSFAAVLRDPSAEVRHHAFAEHNWHDYTAHKRAVRSARFTYVWNAYPDLPGTPPADAVRSPTYNVMQRLHAAGDLSPAQRDCFVAPRPAEELYDALDDPHSLRNLAGDPAYANRLAALRAVLEAWKKETGDSVSETRRPDGFDRQSGKRLKR